MANTNEIPSVQLGKKNQRLGELVREQLMDWIIDGTLKIGQKISEDEIAEKTGTSRMPVREAFRVMESMGLLKSTPYSGTVVKKLSREETIEIYLLRINLEPLACFYAAKGITLEELIELEEIQRKLASMGSYPKSYERTKLVYKINKEFHLKMYEASRMPKLCEFIENLWNIIAYSRINYIGNESYLEKSKKEHDYYIECLKNGDFEAISKSMETNLKNHLNYFNENE